MTSHSARSIDALFDADAARPNTKRRGINSVETGIRVLEVLVTMQKPATLKSIAEASGLDSSQAHRYLSSLVNSGMIRQDAESGLYEIGAKALQIGMAALASLDPISEISEGAREIAQQHGHTCMLSVWSGNGPIVIRWYAGRPPVHSTLEIGSVLPLSTSATGMTFMSYLEANYIDPRLAAEGWKVPLEENHELVELRATVRNSCLASVDSSMIPGLRAYAAPVFGIHNSLLAVLTVVASEAIQKSDDGHMKKNLLETCEDLTIRLGGAWPLNTHPDGD